MTATMPIQTFGSRLAEYVATTLAPQATTTANKFILGAVAAAAPKMLSDALSTPAARAAGICTADGAIDLDQLHTILAAGMDAAGGLTFSVPLSGGIKFTRADVDAFFSSLS